MVITDGLGAFWPSSSVLAISEKAVPETLDQFPLAYVLLLLYVS